MQNPKEEFLKKESQTFFDNVYKELKSLKERNLISSDPLIYFLESNAVEWQYNHKKGIYKTEFIQKIHLN
jgi:hypothetical protein